MYITVIRGISGEKHTKNRINSEKIGFYSITIAKIRKLNYNDNHRNEINIQTTDTKQNH